MSITKNDAARNIVSENTLFNIYHYLEAHTSLMASIVPLKAINEVWSSN